ncbi:hypothetical protein ABLU22_01345 [Acinetobacter lwoffii]|uniref:hypothetical protein n=1 Tax=Acinetobacter lwoffii TaxID=28090 RepID=UPI0032B3BA98
MAVPEQTPYIEHTGNGVTTSFALKFQCESKDHLIVLVDEIEPPIATWSLTGGNVVFTTAPAAGKKITIQRNTPFNRTAEYQSFNNSFRPQTVNIDFDRIWWKLQELGIADWLMKLYVDRLHQQQEQEINDLKDYVDDRDDELRAYLMEEIRKQGVALDQLDDYYNYLMQRLAQIAVDKGWDASFVVDASGKNQQVINNNTAYFHLTVAAMVADESLTDGKVVATKGYHNIFDDGGAIYLISSTATDYSIPLANGLHAVFRDTFDIRKFGIISSSTVRQDANLIRMRNYVDSREYVIDFLGFDIVTPDSNAGISGRESVANGLWFDHPHHYKNLNIYNDKSERLETGKCCLIFCPTKNPDQMTTVIFENINLDPWNDNYQPLTENYLGAYDGMRHGIFIHPKGGSKSIPKSNDEYRCLNFIFKFISVNFLSPAYSYNITQAGVRARAVYVDRLIGDAFLGINLDTYDYFAKNTSGFIRNDLLESGRAMVNSYHHFEPELTGQGEFNRGVISLDNCHSRYKTSTVTSAGQTLWVSDKVKTTTQKVTISHSSGVFEFQNAASVYGHVEILGCREFMGIPTWVAFNNTAAVEKLVVSNTDFGRLRSNTGFFHIVNKGSSIGDVLFDNCNFPYGRVWHLEYSPTQLPNSSTGKITLRNCTAPSFYSTGLLVAPYDCDIVIDGGDYPAGTLVYRGTDIKSLTLKGGVKFAGAAHVSMRYSDPSKDSPLTFEGVIVGGNLRIETSGKTVVNDITFNASGVLNITQPVYNLGVWSAGTGVNTDYIGNVFGESYIKNLAINTTVPANSAVKVVTSVDKYCKDVVFNLTSVDIIKSVSISGTTATISLFNPTASPIVVNETVSLKMIV